EMSGQLPLRSQSDAAMIATASVVQRRGADARFQKLFTGDVEHHIAKLFAVHATHLADLSAALAISPSPARRNFSNKRVLARCRRDRTVPTAQFKTFAAFK